MISLYQFIVNDQVITGMSIEKQTGKSYDPRSKSILEQIQRTRYGDIETSTAPAAMQVQSTTQILDVIRGNGGGVTTTTIHDAAAAAAAAESSNATKSILEKILPLHFRGERLKRDLSSVLPIRDLNGGGGGNVLPAILERLDEPLWKKLKQP